MPTVTLDGVSLTTEALLSCSRNDVVVELSADAQSRVSEARAIVDKVVESGEIVYGINTGFGLFANVTVQNEKLKELQVQASVPSLRGDHSLSMSAIGSHAASPLHARVRVSHRRT